MDPPSGRPAICAQHHRAVALEDVVVSGIGDQGAGAIRFITGRDLIGLPGEGAWATVVPPSAGWLFAFSNIVPLPWMT